MFVLPSTGFEPTPLIHCGTIRLALRPTHSTTSTLYNIYMSNAKLIAFLKWRNTVKPTLRCHFWDKEKWPYKKGDILKEVQLI